MFKIFGKVGLTLAVIALLAGSGCVTPAPVIEETPDLNLIKTQAVETAVMQITAEAKMMPSPTSTEVPSTATPLENSNTPLTATAIPAGGGGGYSNTPMPTWTPIVYGCKFINQTPDDGIQYIGADVDVIWTLKNVGAATWKAGTYYYHWAGYDDISPSHWYSLKEDVPPYATVKVIVDVHVPVAPGKYRTQWYMVNDNGEEFCGFYYYVHAIPLPTPTP